MPAEQSRLFEQQDVQLMMHFTSTTSCDLIGSQQLWTEDVMQLAFQVLPLPVLTKHSAYNNIAHFLDARNPRPLSTTPPESPLSTIT